MCLLNEDPPKANEYIGYTVVKRRTHSKDDNSYDPVYFPTPAYTYNIGVREEAVIAWNLASSSSYFGFHGFKDLQSAKLLMGYLKILWAGKDDVSKICIVEAHFEEVLAEGDYIDIPLRLCAFRAKYRTILREIPEETREEQVG